jgi:hypothetical protein
MSHIDKEFDMNEGHSCDACSQGCAARHTEEKVSEEVQAGPYLLFAAVLIVVVSVAVKWLL